MKATQAQAQVSIAQASQAINAALKNITGGLVQRRQVVASAGSTRVTIRGYDPDMQDSWVVPCVPGLNPQPGDSVLTVAVHGRETAIANLSREPVAAGAITHPVDVVPFRVTAETVAGVPNTATPATITTATVDLPAGEWGLWATASAGMKRSVATGGIVLRLASKSGANATTYNAAEWGDMTQVRLVTVTRIDTVTIPAGGQSQAVTLGYHGLNPAGTTTYYTAQLSGYWYRIA